MLVLAPVRNDTVVAPNDCPVTVAVAGLTDTIAGFDVASDHFTYDVTSAATVDEAVWNDVVARSCACVNRELQLFSGSANPYTISRFIAFIVTVSGSVGTHTRRVAEKETPPYDPEMSTASAPCVPTATLEQSAATASEPELLLVHMRPFVRTDALVNL